MQFRLSLAPRYTLDDSSPWLIGIDPVRRYWLNVNGEADITIQIPGLMSSSFERVKESVQRFRASVPGTTITLSTFTSKQLVIHHIADNVYAIPHPVREAATWHLFDRETIESFLLTAHPDWQCAPQDVALGRDLIYQSWQQPTAA